ncbi:hypothetical protein BS78_01G297100 [Paspalum vaginatum]|nr:hypothetical protein BS78_01G297100 [Paspalum vaginatum]
MAIPAKPKPRSAREHRAAQANKDADAQLQTGSRCQNKNDHGGPGTDLHSAAPAPAGFGAPSRSDGERRGVESSEGTATRCYAMPEEGKEASKAQSPRRTDAHAEASPCHARGTPRHTRGRPGHRMIVGSYQQPSRRPRTDHSAAPRSVGCQRVDGTGTGQSIPAAASSSPAQRRILSLHSCFCTAGFFSAAPENLFPPPLRWARCQKGSAKSLLLPGAQCSYPDRARTIVAAGN